MFPRRHTAAAVILAALGCSQITGDFSRVIAIQLSGPATRTVQEGDTLTLTATALDAAGDPVLDAVIVWAVIDTGLVGFTLDSLTGLVTGTAVSSARVQARIEALRSGPTLVSVTPAPDSIVAAGDTVLTTAAGVVASPGMQAQLLDLTTPAGVVASLAGLKVTFSLAAGPLASVFLSVGAGDTVPTGDGSTTTVTTGGPGVAAAFLRRTTGLTAPDTVLVEARATTRSGVTVPGSPVTFMVLFQN